MSNQGEALSIIIITMVLTLQHHSCLLSATLHGYQGCHTCLQDKQEDIYPPPPPPYTMQRPLLHSHRSTCKVHTRALYVLIILFFLYSHKHCCVCTYVYLQDRPSVVSEMKLHGLKTTRNFTQKHKHTLICI